MLIPYSAISEEALQSLAKDWVISNISDTETLPDVADWTLSTIEKIKKGELVIEFGEESQSVYLKSKDELEFAASNNSQD